jgi:hypothetical protein
MPKAEKKINPFNFRDCSKQELVDQLNEKDPISLKYNEELVNRVCERYPYIEKYETALIVKQIFSAFRDLLILGKILNLNKLFFNFKLNFFTHQRNGVIYPCVKTHINTPPKIRKS